MMPDSRVTLTALLFFFVTIAGCISKMPPQNQYPEIKNIAVMVISGLVPATHSPGEKKLPCEKLSDIIENKILHNLEQYPDYTARSLSSVFPETMDQTGKTELRFNEKIPADEFDAALLCILSRCNERQGSAFSVSKPADVKLKMMLLELPGQKILWEKEYSEAQTSLSENLLTAGEFIKRKGKWVTVSELATEGVDLLMRSLPLKKTGIKKTQ
jgi:hypothetical protein